jgi:hypothetical protein
VSLRRGGIFSAASAGHAKVTSVLDIEESVWSPLYGLKGQIDGSLVLEVEGEERVVPLELKTGARRNDTEHAAQVSLYLLLMADRYARQVCATNHHPSHLGCIRSILYPEHIVSHLKASYR